MQKMRLRAEETHILAEQDLKGELAAPLVMLLVAQSQEEAVWDFLDTEAGVAVQQGITQLLEEGEIMEAETARLITDHQVELPQLLGLQTQEVVAAGPQTIPPHLTVLLADQASYISLGGNNGTFCKN